MVDRIVQKSVWKLRWYSFVYCCYFAMNQPALSIAMCTALSVCIYSKQARAFHVCSTFRTCLITGLSAL